MLFFWMDNIALFDLLGCHCWAVIVGLYLLWLYLLWLSDTVNDDKRSWGSRASLLSFHFPSHVTTASKEKKRVAPVGQGRVVLPIFMNPSRCYAEN